MSTTGTTRSTRTVEPAPSGPRDPRRGERATAVTSGAWAAVQGVVLSFAVVCLLSVAAAVGTGADAGDLASAAGVATGLWLLGHGVPLAAGVGTVTVVPLGIGALALFTVYVAAKRSALPTLAAWVGATGLYAAVTTAAAVLTRGPDADPAVRAALGLLAGVLVGGAGAALGILAAPDGPAPALPARLEPHVPDVLRLGLRAGGVGVLAVLAAGAALTAVWVLAGRATSDDIVAGLEPGWLGGGVLAVAQLALLPNLVLWAVAWVAGPGFAVGHETQFAVSGTTAGPLPALPILGALPGPDWSSPYAVWLPAVVVGCGALAGWYAWRSLEPSLVRWADLAWVAGGVVVAPGAGVGLLEWWAGGAVGPGRLSVVGADPVLVGATVAAEVGVGAALVLAAAHLRTTRAAGPDEA
ncbi:DUF6350 family protein [Isoptericola variabilis]|uniref:PE-PGRS family protein n=1 Tax=Isoptericola variabilis (strain 225) TaxID=743718 RepID=F6FWX7_ISOV2|nr:DUF6350 family protein [Isoptericola variabilis]AEG43549.1 PE-PGRS family protein [Isoptericola variabilis 225]TWH32083.1 hypothetical protein L600_000200001070 [Isoptericola variabilis J7]